MDRAAGARLRGRPVGLGPVRPQDACAPTRSPPRPARRPSSPCARTSRPTGRARAGSAASPRATRSSSRGPSAASCWADAETRRAALRGRGDRHRPHPLHPDRPRRARRRDRPARSSTGRVTPAGSSTTTSSGRWPAGARRSRIIRSCRPTSRADSGEIAAAVDRLVTDVGGLVAYVAGGEATINRVREVLMAKGLERKAVKWEKFW